MCTVNVQRPSCLRYGRRAILTSTSLVFEILFVRLYGDPGLATELATFEAAVPNFKTLRNFIEHFDSYDNKSGQLHLGTKKLTASVPFGRMGYAQAYDFPTGDASIEIFGLRLTVIATQPHVARLAIGALVDTPVLPVFEMR